MNHWLLVDYGEVISTALPQATIDQLVAHTGLERAELLRRYWAERPSYDLGEPDADYWGRVLHRAPGDIAELAGTLTRIDIHGWTRLNSLTLRALTAHTRRTGARLALLSNAPETLAAAIDRTAWAARHVTHRYYSARLGRAKPDPATFTVVLAALDATPSDVLFIDDRAENTEVAERLGMATITFTSASALDRELRLRTAARREPTARRP